MRYLNERITTNKAICHGKPTIRGLRYPVKDLLELLASGMTVEEILIEFPDLEREDFLSCLHYAAKVIETGTVFLI